MVLRKEIELAFKPQSTEVEAQEDLILADSVLELANSDFTKSNDIGDVTPGAIRKHIEADLSTAYPGKPTTRKKAFQYDGMAEESGESDSDEHMQETEESEEEQGQEESSSSAEDNDENEYDSEADGSILGGEKSSQGSDADEDNEKGMKDESSIDIFSSRARDVESGIAKGKAIQSQFALWEKLIECRIKLQPALISINKMFQKDTFNEFKSNLNLEDEEIVMKVYPELNNMMKESLELLENFQQLSPDYTQTNAKKRKLLDEDENIKEYNEASKKKKRDGNLDLLGELHEEFKTFRNTTLDVWNEKTRVSSGKINKNDFSAFDFPITKQIEEILLDRNRLLKRTRTKRSEYCVLGKIESTLPEDDVEEEEVNQKKRNQGDIDIEIFDDDDFYHKLLRDFIEKKTSDVSKKGKQWVELQKLRSRMKAKVDTRASKGRKLSYKVHTKLVNFMAPVPCHTWTDEARDELFKSLFH